MSVLARCMWRYRTSSCRDPTKRSSFSLKCWRASVPTQATHLIHDARIRVRACVVLRDSFLTEVSILTSMLSMTEPQQWLKLRAKLCPCSTQVRQERSTGHSLELNLSLHLSLLKTSSMTVIHNLYSTSLKEVKTLREAASKSSACMIWRNWISWQTTLIHDQKSH